MDCKVRIFRIAFITMASLLFISSSCVNNKKKDDPKPTYYMSEEFKSYVVFPEGSRWVYSDSVFNAEFDTVVLDKMRIFISPEADKISFNSELIDGMLISSQYDTLIIKGGRVMEGLHTYEILPGDNIYSLRILLFLPSATGPALKNGQIEPAFNNNVKFIRKLDSLQIRDQWYYNVRIYEVLNQEYTEQPRIIYFAENAGMVKKVMFNGRVWELEKYHIND